MKLYGAFIGINDYADSNISTLRYAERDAERLYDLFARHLGCRERRLELLTGREATKDAVLDLIGEQFSREARAQDVVVLSFSCHGSPEAQGSIDTTSRYLIMHDTKYEKIYTTGIDMERELITACFRRIRAKLVILFADTCFSGRSGGRTFEGPQLLGQRIRSGLRDIVKLSQLDVGAGKVILAACGDNELARESDELESGVFTHFLIEELTRPGQEAISITHLYDQIAKQVAAYSDNLQHPTLKGETQLAQLPIFGNLE